VSKQAGETHVLYLVDTRNLTGYAQVLEELTVSGSNTNLARAYTYGLDLISQRHPNTSTNFFGYDGLGSTRLLTDSDGTVINTFTYDAYGTLIGSGTTAQSAYLYTGEQWDSDLALYYLRARYLKPDTGRFWTMDTFEGSQSDTMSLHKYLYTHANPVNHTDPSGHWSCAQVLSTAFISGFIAALGTPYIANAPGPRDPTYSGLLAEDVIANFSVGFLFGAGFSAGSQGKQAFLSRKLRAPVASRAETLGETVLKDVADDAFVHFTPIENKVAILSEGLQYTEGGVGTHFFRAGDIKDWTLTQARAAIGELAASRQANAVAIVSRETAHAAGLEEFEMFSWTEYVTRQQRVPVVDVREVPTASGSGN
jgi:RHS repeat-associated protein